MSLNKKYFKALEEYHTRKNINENKTLIFIIIILGVLAFAVLSYLIIYKHEAIFNYIRSYPISYGALFKRLIF
jgi:hypothetical protein